MTKRPAPTGAGKSASLRGGPNEAQAMTDTTKPNGTLVENGIAVSS